MKNLVIRAGGLGPRIYIGRPNAKGTAFTSKEERTDEVLLAVADLVTYHYGGDFNAKYTAGDDSEEMTISVQVVRRPK